MDLYYPPMNMSFEEGYLEPGSLTAMTIECPKDDNHAVVFSGPNVAPLKISHHDHLWFWLVLKGPLTRQPTNLINFASVFTQTVKKIDPGASDEGIDGLDAASENVYKLYYQAESWESSVFGHYRISKDPSDLLQHLNYEMEQAIIKLVMKYFSTKERLEGLFRLASDCEDEDTLRDVVWIVGFLIKAFRQKCVESARDIVSGAENVRTHWWGPVAKILIKQNLSFGPFAEVYNQRLARYRWNLASIKADRIKRKNHRREYQERQRLEDPTYQVSDTSDEELDHDGVDLSWFDGKKECKLPNPEHDTKACKLELIKFMYDLIILFATFEANITNEQLERVLKEDREGYEDRMYHDVGRLLIISGIPALRHAAMVAAKQQAASAVLAASNNIFA